MLIGIHRDGPLQINVEYHQKAEEVSYVLTVGYEKPTISCPHLQETPESLAAAFFHARSSVLRPHVRADPAANEYRASHERCECGKALDL